MGERVVFITLGEVEVTAPKCSSGSKGSKRLFGINENLQSLSLTLSLTGILRNSWAVADTTSSTTTSLKPGSPLRQSKNLQETHEKAYVGISRQSLL